MTEQTYVRPKVSKANWEKLRAKFPYVSKGKLIDYVLDNYFEVGINENKHTKPT